MNLSDVALLAKEELSLAEKGIASAKVVLTGFVVVFAMLILLIFIIKIYGAIIQKAQDAGKKSKEKKESKKKFVRPVYEDSTGNFIKELLNKIAKEDGSEDEEV